MKRYFCTVVIGLLLALASTGTATAGLPLLGQSGTQVASFGDQTVGEQKNEADVDQWQGNGNVNISPAVAIFGDAETWNAQGNGNTATANVDQSNSVEQSQSSTQKQWLDQNGGTCCKQHPSCEPKHECSPKDHGESPVWTEKGGTCCDQSQTGEQETTFGDQTVGKQKNDADVTQKQGNGNVNVSPAVALGGKHESCGSCKGSSPSHGKDAKTVSGQGNGNTAGAWVDQSNSVTQTQDARQFQSFAEWCKGLVAN